MASFYVVIKGTTKQVAIETTLKKAEEKMNKFIINGDEDIEVITNSERNKRFINELSTVVL